MKIKEVIAENTIGATTLGSKKAGPSLTTAQTLAIPRLKTFPDLPSHYYDMYRLGVHMAGSPDNQKMDPRSAVANQMAVVAYSDEDANIINKSAKEMGIAIKALSDSSSSELPDTNKKSPTLNPGPIKRKSK